MSTAITEFRDKYVFLSNFYPCVIHYAGYTFQNSEAAFQAAKCPARMAEFCHIDPSAAKKLGRKIEIRPDWEEVKENVMLEICWIKFSQNPELKKLLLATGDRELIEGNTWGDRIWGVCGGVGENKLGKILMLVRYALAHNLVIEFPKEITVQKSPVLNDEICLW